MRKIIVGALAFSISAASAQAVSGQAAPDTATALARLKDRTQNAQAEAAKGHSTKGAQQHSADQKAKLQAAHSTAQSAPQPPAQQTRKP